jgi:hypothetical protein
MKKMRFRPGVLAPRRQPMAQRPAAAAAPVITLIASLRPQSEVIVHGMIRSVGTVLLGSGPACHFTLVDGSGELDVLFPGRSDLAGLQPSTRIIADGSVGSYRGKLALWNPRYAIQPTGG